MDRLIPASTALLVVDVQERLAAAMPSARMEELSRNVGILLGAAAQLGVRVIASEQYPRGLGPTIAPEPKLIIGSDADKKDDGSLYKMVRFPKAGCWVSYLRTNGDSPMTIVTLQKLQP